MWQTGLAGDFVRPRGLVSPEGLGYHMIKKRKRFHPCTTTYDKERLTKRETSAIESRSTKEMDNNGWFLYSPKASNAEISCKETFCIKTIGRSEGYIQRTLVSKEKGVWGEDNWWYRLKVQQYLPDYLLAGRFARSLAEELWKSSFQLRWWRNWT